MKLLGVFSAIFTFLSYSIAFNRNQEWDLAVAVNNHLELILANGTKIRSSNDGFVTLKAMTFDSIRHQFLVSDMDDKNDTIYAINLTKETDFIASVIPDISDDVQGLAVDPIEDILYWTDAYNRTINSVSLRNGEQERKILFHFTNKRPQGITIDVCNRYIYFTNSDVRFPTIERTKIGSEKQQVIVNTDLILPAGITIDYKTQRLYWADMGGGIYYTIESTNLLGQEREVVYQGFNAKPFGIAIKNEILYFTDITNKALMKFNLTEREQPEVLKQFEEEPRGLVTYKLKIRSLSDCKIFENAFKTNKSAPIRKNLQNIFQKVPTCLNGNLTNNMCKCDLGFSGTNCEISLCHNYCFHGSCHLSQLGYPICQCTKGFGGTRCEKNCEGFCLNGGKCRFDFQNARTPTCSCLEGFYGSRCSRSVATDKLCSKFCSDKIDSNFQQEEYSFCKCHFYINSSSEAFVQKKNMVHYLKDPVFIVLFCVTVFTLVVCVTLSICIIQIRKRPAPRIRRRYIVNKNVSSLTERPHAPEQCEITIENCCNMNVCETPCFEPSKLQSYQNRSDDKKLLLPNMEKGEDLY